MVDSSHLKLSGAFGKFSPFKVLVLGDLMLDTYTLGKVKRISPEAPVAVIQVEKQEERPGGAGNVILSLLALGAQVKAMGRVGSDIEGERLKKIMANEGTDLSWVFEQKGFQTPLKSRFIGSGQQLLRVDREEPTLLEDLLEKEVEESLVRAIEEVDIVAISDYGKGFLTPKILQTCIRLAKKRKIPVLVDPKGVDFTKYQGATVLKPNLHEAYAAAKCEGKASLDEVAAHIFEQVRVDELLITKSEAGMTLFSKNAKRRTDFPVHSKEVKDVTGAGDTVLAVICLALASQLELSIAVELANVAAGIAIERLGCAQVTLGELAKRLFEIDCDSKIYDDNYSYALKKRLSGEPFSLLVLEKGQEMTHHLFKTIRRLSKEEQKLILYLKDPEPDEDFLHFLSSFHEVESIILEKKSLLGFFRELSPQKIHFLEKEKSHLLEKEAFLS